MHSVGPDDLPQWFRGRKRVLVARGKRCQEHTLRGIGPDDRAALVLGPSGKLRAPTLLVGELMIVGYNEDAYRAVFG